MLELGKYSIDKKEYTYLMGMFKKQVLMSIDPDLTDDDLSTEVSSGVTLSDYIEYKYASSFEQSILTLLYAQLMFDEYGLKLTEEEKNQIKEQAYVIYALYGSEKLSEYGFDRATLESVYEKQLKEEKVRQYILGKNNEKITDAQIENYYLENYLRYKVIVINTMYSTHVDSEGRLTYIPLTETEKKNQELLVKELKELLVNKNTNYNYVLLKDDLSLTYDQLWEKYSDDHTFPNGYYGPSNPSEEALANSKVLAAAYQSKVGEVKTITATRFLSQNEAIQGGSGGINVNPGDYFEYGTTFVKRLPLDSKPYKNSVYSELFSSLESSVANYVYFTTLMEHEKTSALSVNISNKVSKITFESVKANEIDYEYRYGVDG